MRMLRPPILPTALAVLLWCAAAPGGDVTVADRTFWSFQAPKAAEPPVSTTNATWPRNRVDRFVLGRLEAKGLRPTPEAPKPALIRRLSFDLTGLPPAPEEVEAFVLDNRPDAYERLVDRLLDSPRFGERMASLWLPLARYAEDQAHQVGDDTKFFYPNAWKYRKWVIDAFNRDLPYDKFVAYQLAADKLEGAAPEDQAALGFLGLGPKYYNRGRTEVMADEWEDRVDTVTRTMLGLTVACARCHDHKFDPIPTADYYSLAGVFASTKMVNRKPDGSVQDKELDAKQVDPDTVHIVTDGDAKDLHVFLRGSVERKGELAPRHFLSILSKDAPAPFKEGSGRKELAEKIASSENPLTARVMVNRVWGMLFGAPIVATPSNFGRSGQPPSDQVLLDDLAVQFTNPSTSSGQANSTSSGQANSTSSGQANSTSSGQANSTSSGQATSTSSGRGWSVKWLVRELVTSAAYRQSAAVGPGAATIDPANELLSRMSRRRLSIEQWRDAVLFVAGKLDETGGKSLELSDPENLRRTVYARVSRLKLNDLLLQFDYPDANVHAEKRSGTNTATQKLFMLNSPFMLGQSKAFASRVAGDAGDSGEARVRRGFALLFARQPDGDELKLAAEFLGRPDSQSAGMNRWEQYCQALLISNEALYVD